MYMVTNYKSLNILHKYVIIVIINYIPICFCSISY